MPELVLSQEMSAGPARLRVDVLGGPARESIVNDMDFLNYRLAAVTMEEAVTLDAPDVIWDVEADTDISYDGHAMNLAGEWSAGAIQKGLVESFSREFAYQRDLIQSFRLLLRLMPRSTAEAAAQRTEDLRAFLRDIHYPLAVRSSGLRASNVSGTGYSAPASR